MTCNFYHTFIIHGDLCLASIKSKSEHCSPLVITCFHGCTYDDFPFPLIKAVQQLCEVNQKSHPEQDVPRSPLQAARGVQIFYKLSDSKS